MSVTSQHFVLGGPESYRPDDRIRRLILAIGDREMFNWRHDEVGHYLISLLSEAGFLVNEQNRFPIRSRENHELRCTEFWQDVPMSRFLEPPPVNGSRIVGDNATGRVVRVGDVVYADDRPVGIALNAAPQDGHIEVQLGNVTTAAPRTPKKPAKRPEIHPVRTKRAINLEK